MLASEVDSSCEKVGFKREFGMQVVGHHMSKAGCAFEELISLSSYMAPCSKHNRDCAVKRRSCNHSCGFSCKDMRRCGT